MIAKAKPKRVPVNGPRELSNHQIMTVAVYLLGGDSRYVDTEDVAFKVNELAPGRFTWRKYKEQINIENIRAFLSDAKKPKNGAYLVGAGKEGWLLTQKGVEFARSRLRSLESADLSRERLTPKDRKWRRTERTRLLCEAAMGKFVQGDREAISRREAEAFFRVDDYVVGQARERKVLRILNAFGDDPELGNAVKELAKLVQGK